MKKNIVASILGTAVGAVAGYTVGTKRTRARVYKQITQGEERGDKYYLSFMVAHEWLKIKQNGGKIESFFIQNNFQRVAIYGMGYLGERLYIDLLDTGIEVAYGIDRRADASNDNLQILTLDDELPKVDAIVVAAPYYFDEIFMDLRKLVDYPIINLEDIVCEFTM